MSRKLFFFNRFLIGIGLICLGLGFLGGLLASIVPVKRTITEIIVKRTVHHQTVVETVTERLEGPSPNAAGCLDGKIGTVVSIYTEKLNDGDKDNPDAWTWDNVVVFKLPKTDTVITCDFDEANQNLSKVWTPGMKINSTAGKRVI